MSQSQSKPWWPQEGPQCEAIKKHWVTELFYGGAVGGGKSDFLLGDYAQDVPEYGSAWQGILFRKTYPQLEELISRSKEIYPPWFPGCEWKATEKTWHFPNGAALKMRHMENPDDWMNYWGHQYQWMGWDELPSWPDLNAYAKMKARLRSAKGVPNMRIRATGNPGGTAHHQVKEYFGIDHHPSGGVVFDMPDKTTRLFIKSRVQDNRILMEADPGYVDRLRGLGSDALVRAWLDGDWSVVQGAYFDCWHEGLILRAFAIPDDWTRFRAFDWGSARPFSVGWWAIARDDYDAGGRLIPKGALICYREWYGASAPNVGLKLTAEQVTAGILEREQGETITYGVADPAIWIADGGPSIAERMITKGVHWRPADNKRVAGWDQVRRRMIGVDGKPMAYWFSTCTDSIRTIPAAQHDRNRPEDIDSDGEDHAIDQARYALMSRPMDAPLAVVPPPKADLQLDYLIREHKRSLGNRKRI